MCVCVCVCVHVVIVGYGGLVWLHQFAFLAGPFLLWRVLYWRAICRVSSVCLQMMCSVAMVILSCTCFTYVVRCLVPHLRNSAAGTSPSFPSYLCEGMVWILWGSML